jgi:demethylmenaquinone methyltransferase/2-methoxy-6-polyprenyl-1,4-benzoquinol methylase
VYHAAFRRTAPLAGSLFGRRSAYAYLPASLDRFPDAERLAESMRAAGLVDVRFRRLALGGVALHVGVVSGGA